MKKHLLIPLFFMAFLVVCITACQKESQQTTTAVSALAIDDLAADRTNYSVSNPCGNRQSVWVFHLAANGIMPMDAFKLGWKSGELDRIANDCVLGNTIPGNCDNGGMESFYELPATFNVSNFVDANGYVIPQQQDRIISLALAWAASHITSCGTGTSPTIYQIDFVTTLQTPAMFQFAVRYSCCPSAPTGGG